jgi:hypothetical protein
MSAQNASTLTHEPLIMSDIPFSPEAKITVERLGAIVLIGVNRPQVYNRFDPDAFFGLAKAYYDFDNDPSLRAAVLFGHGENFSRGIDVDAFAPLARTGEPFAVADGMLDPFARTQKLSKPLIAVVHGDTWNMGHELHLVADIRVASADARFGQDENTHGRFPGGGSTIRFPREAGWGNAWSPRTSRSTNPKQRPSPSSMSNSAHSSTPRTSSRAATPKQKDVPPSTTASRHAHLPGHPCLSPPGGPPDCRSFLPGADAGLNPVAEALVHVAPVSEGAL